MDRTIFMSSNEWKFPLNIAVGLHILVLICSIYLPDIFKAKPKFADIYTVSIINIAEPLPTPSPPAEQPVEQQPEPEQPAPVKEAVPIAEIVQKPKVTAPKAVSLKPLRKKIKRKVATVDNSRQIKQLERLKRDRLAAARQEEQLLEEQARIAREALEAERQLLSQNKVPPAAQSSQKKAGSTQVARATGSSNRNLIESQYFAAIVNRLHQYWALPANLQKNPDLTAVAVITIRKNGKIANLIFESKSGDRVFDQFVRQAIASADPLPPIPPALKRQRFEIGLRFKPGSIQ